MIRRIAATLAGIARSLRAILGVPDYERYVNHMRACHCVGDVLTREDFARERAESRYNKPGSRCC
ncbi:MAG: YbdD/YjiX family protein [Gemmatimonadota bacterium]|nr:YbdD/YjiX family protein [Gemmatimonadota bacterium]